MATSAVHVPQPVSSSSWFAVAFIRIRQGTRWVRDAILPRAWAIGLEMRENSRGYDKAMANLRARNARPDDLEAEESSWACEYWALQEEAEQIESARLLRELDRLMLPHPTGLADDGSENWRQGSRVKPIWYLTRVGMKEARAAIHGERRARLEPFSEWIKIIGATIGGIGGFIVLLDRIRTLLH